MSRVRQRGRQPFGEWLLRRLILGVVMGGVLLILASILPGLIEDAFLQAIPDTPSENTP